MKTSDLLIYELKKDTRNNNDLHTYSIKERISKDEYITLNETLKKCGCYYSKFVKGFICETLLDDEIEMTKETTQKQVKQSNKVEYFKNVLDYITIEDYQNFLNDYAEKNLFHSWTWRNGQFKTNDEALQAYKKELFDNLEWQLKNHYFGNLDYIREAIIHKSLNLKPEELQTNGNLNYYLAIWGKLPIIEGLEITKDAYTSMWGYDQTNVDIAYKLNKRVWGLDVVKVITNKGEYMLVRIKENGFHDKVRYFHKDSNPSKTFENDASQTGQYR